MGEGGGSNMNNQKGECGRKLLKDPHLIGDSLLKLETGAKGYKMAANKVRGSACLSTTHKLRILNS